LVIPIMPVTRHSQYQRGIELLYTCADACDSCASVCLAGEDMTKTARCVRLDIECANLCRTTASLLSSDSAFARRLCGLCADVCDTCAIECARHREMEHCVRCADTCKACATECRRIAGEARRLAAFSAM
jgi:hypothetical protein